ncbi:MAG: hypothetical protein GF317_03620 [Candidatus Lokiarchaeota archaeon]|nr:hypothetical protein [Candidatus Lokiarchaeota archaeon]MBD3198976.1 hypothetical protein [Candidatus Lokiarchaeota archaeon]
MNSELYGYFHFFYNLDNYIDTIQSIAMNYFGIGIGKFIILNDQILTNNGTVKGEKGKLIYVFTSIFSDKKKFEKVLEDGIITKENCIELDAVRDDEFDQKGNLKKAKTLNCLEKIFH